MPDTALAPLQDIEAIRRTIALYGQLLDDSRFEDWSALFTPDAEFWSVPGHHLPGGHEIAKIIGREAIVSAISDNQTRMAAEGGTIHFGGSPVIRVTGETARAWWDFTVYHAKPSGTKISFCGRYYADLARSDGHWKFRRRVSVRPGYPLPQGIVPVPGPREF